MSGWVTTVRYMGEPIALMYSLPFLSAISLGVQGHCSLVKLRCSSIGVSTGLKSTISYGWSMLFKICLFLQEWNSSLLLICSLFPLIEDNRLQFLVQLVISDTAPVLKSSPLSDEISGVAEFTRRSSYMLGTSVRWCSYMWCRMRIRCAGVWPSGERGGTLWPHDAYLPPVPAYLQLV